jgi:hypothetical protein
MECYFGSEGLTGLVGGFLDSSSIFAYASLLSNICPSHAVSRLKYPSIHLATAAGLFNTPIRRVDALAAAPTHALLKRLPTGWFRNLQSAICELQHHMQIERAAFATGCHRNPPRADITGLRARVRDKCTSSLPCLETLVAGPGWLYSPAILRPRPRC